MACWDAIGRAAGQPLYNLLGGQFRRRVSLAVRLPDLPPPQAATLARELADRGAQAILLGACGDLDDDLATLALARRQVAGRAALWLDGDRRYGLEGAIRLGQRLATGGAAYFLDPLADPAPHNWARLAERAAVPLATRCRGSLAELHSLLAVDVIRLALLGMSQAGGVSAARACAALAHAAGLAAGVVCDTGVGIAASLALHLAASTPALSQGLLCGHPPWTDEVLAEPLSRLGDALAPPVGAGLGVAIDRAKVDRYLIG
jgi:L-alanine-DL-glutamate epimerase-like enolase superfamily enzyme